MQITELLWPGETFQKTGYQNVFDRVVGVESLADGGTRVLFGTGVYRYKEPLPSAVYIGKGLDDVTCRYANPTVPRFVR